jgi:hypothetical protein
MERGNASVKIVTVVLALKVGKKSFVVSHIRGRKILSPVLRTVARKTKEEVERTFKNK